MKLSFSKVVRQIMLKAVQADRERKGDDSTEIVLLTDG